MKRLLRIVLILMFIIGLKSANVNYKKIAIKEYLKEMNMPDYSVSSIDILEDLDNNSYLLYNLKPTGYAIFESQSLTFIEGSFITNSLYDDYHETKYYLGPFNYYITKDNKYYNLINRNYDDENYLKIISQNFHMQIIANNKNESNNLNFNLEDNNLKVNNWTYIKNYQYFQNLYDFPDNIDGSCGFVALAMILGYLDTYYDDNIVNDKYIVQSSIQYSRGIKDELQYILMDYGHYIKIPFTNITRAATARNIYDTFVRYRREYIPVSTWENSFVLYHEAPLIGKSIPTDEIKYLIDKGKPVILIMRNYTYQKNEGSSLLSNNWHDIIAYGYNGDKFITHFGWNVKGANQFILNSAIIQSYITIDYFN